MTIDILATQKNLVNCGFNPGPLDGLWGQSTITALLAHQAGRQPDAMIRALGKGMSVYLPKYHISDNVFRLSEYLAECAHETGGYKTFEENLHYSAARLVQVWPNRFKTIAQAAPYAGDEVALANKVYGGRMGNEINGTDDNDGWDNRGGGLLQHTGAGEYKLLKDRLGLTSDQIHHDPVSMVIASCDYWERRNLNSLCDKGAFTTLREKVNGGTNGIGEITKRRQRTLTVLK